MSLALTGQRVALFKTQHVLSCNSNYFGYRRLRNTLYISQINVLGVNVGKCWVIGITFSTTTIKRRSIKLI